MVYIFLKESNKSNLYIINLYSSIFSLKADLAKKYNIKLDNILLKYQGNVLENAKTFKSYKIKEKETIDLIIKNNGGTVSRGLLIFLAIIIILFYVGMFLTGFLPLISHMASAAIIAPFRALFNFIFSLLSDKNPLKSGSYVFGAKIFSVIKFIISNLSILIFSVIITALAAFLPYYLHKKDLCKAIRSCFALGGITGVLFSVIYLMYSLPNIILNLIGTSSGGLTKYLVMGLKKFDFIIKRIGIFFCFPLSGVYSQAISILETILDKTAEAEDFAQNFIYNFEQFKDNLSLPPYKQYTAPIQPEIDLLNYTYLSEKDQKKQYLSRCKIQQSYILRFGIDNLFGLILIMFDSLKSICPSSFASDFQNEIDGYQNKKEDVEIKLKDTKEKKKVNKLKKKLESYIKQIARLEKSKEKAETTEVVNKDCIMGYFVNGILASYPFTFIIWLILFFLILFTPLAENLGK
jgi:hypothetical protein